MSTTNDFRQQTDEWLTALENTSGRVGVVHEVAAVLAENNAYSRSQLRYRQTLFNVRDMLITLYDDTGNEKLIDMAHDLRRLIDWSDHDKHPVQLDLFPPEAVATP